MAKEQQFMQRSILTPTQAIQPGSAFERMGQAAGEVGSLLASKATNIAIDQAAQQGALDVAEGKQPKNLAFPLTKATQAYNKAVSNVEARRMLISAQSQMQEALINDTNPATFDSTTPAKFSSTLQGIVEGTLQNARDENKEAVQEALLQSASSMSLKMLQHSINFDNQQAKQDFSHDVSGLLNARRNAVIAGNDELVQGIDAALNSTLDDYSVINKEIDRAIPDVREKIQQSIAIDKQLGSFSTALSEGRQAQWLADFMQNKDGLPFDTWQEASRQVLALEGTQQRLKNDIHAQELTQVSNAIKNGTLQDVDDILSFNNLTVPDKLNLMTELKMRQQKQAASQSKFLQAQQDILRGRAPMLSSDIKNQMFANTLTTFEKATGQVPTLIDMEQSILGTNAFPVSGMQGIPLGTNVPKFDAQLSAQLTSGDPTAVQQAAAIYNDMVSIKEKPNTLNISGDALSVATLYNELNTGAVPPEEVAQRASNTVLNAKDPEIKLRAERFHREFEVNPRNGKAKMDGIFKDIFGVNPQDFKTDAAYSVLSDTFRSHYLSTNSEQAAIDATRYEMRAWCTSKYFEDGVVAQPCPEKELSIAQVGNAFDNQISARLQGLVEQNKKLRDAGLNIPTIEWVRPEQNIDLSKLTDEQRVFDKLGSPKAQKGLGASVAAPFGAGVLFSGASGKPRIKVNGEETEVFLVPGPDARLGDRVRYALGYHDRFGNLQLLPDPENKETQVAQFAPVGLETWAPSIFEGQKSEEIKRIASNIQKQQARDQWDRLKGLGALGKVFPGLDTAAKLTNENAVAIFNNMMSGNTEEVERLLHQKIQKNEGQDVQEELSVSDNIGISSGER